MILSFGWTTDAFVLLQKNRTRRDHALRTVEQFERAFARGDPIDAWNTGPRVIKHIPPPGKIGEIFLTERPWYETRPPPAEDWEREGFHVLEALGVTLNGHSPRALWRYWQNPLHYEDAPLDGHLTVVYSFEIVKLTKYGQQLAADASRRYAAALEGTVNAPTD